MNYLAIKNELSISHLCSTHKYSSIMFIRDKNIHKYHIMHNYILHCLG